VLLCSAHCYRAARSKIVYWNGSRLGVLSCHQGSFRKEEYRSMRIHLDRKQLDGLDGNLVALLLISLIIIVALAY
jgi:hypothetical protein